jgi:hypothetical protein
MTHPLTDDIIEEISVSYLKNCEGVKSNMRSAADWQLEQVIDWIEEYLTAGDVISESLKEAMRPQQQEDK